MKYTQAAAALAGTLVALGSATPAFAQHDAGHGMAESPQVAAAQDQQEQAGEVTGRQVAQLMDLATPRKLLAEVKSEVDGLQLREEAVARRVHPAGQGAVPAPGALIGGLTAGGGPIGVPIDSLG